MIPIAVLVLVSVLAVSLWAIRAGPNALQEFGSMWKLPWGKQVFIDFYGLEVILALWMIEDASQNGTMTAAIVSIVAMPIFGAMSAAAYWLVR